VWPCQLSPTCITSFIQPPTSLHVTEIDRQIRCVVMLRKVANFAASNWPTAVQRRIVLAAQKHIQDRWSTLQRLMSQRQFSVGLFSPLKRHPQHRLIYDCYPQRGLESFIDFYNNYCLRYLTFDMTASVSSNRYVLKYIQ
jgi:hypothetical protein